MPASPNYPFTDDDGRNPVYCLGCKGHIPLTMWKATGGLCSVCHSRKVPVPPITSHQPPPAQPATADSNGLFAADVMIGVLLILSAAAIVILLMSMPTKGDQPSRRVMTVLWTIVIAAATADAGMGVILGLKKAFYLTVAMCSFFFVCCGGGTLYAYMMAYGFGGPSNAKLDPPGGLIGLFAIVQLAPLIYAFVRLRGLGPPLR